MHRGTDVVAGVVGEWFGSRSAADGGRGLEYEHLSASAGKACSGSEPVRTGTHHDDIPHAAKVAELAPDADYSRESRRMPTSFFALGITRTSTEWKLRMGPTREPCGEWPR